MPSWSSAILTTNAINKIKYRNISDWELKMVFDGGYKYKQASRLSGCTDFVWHDDREEIGIIASPAQDDKWKIVSVWKRKLYKP